MTAGNMAESHHPWKTNFGIPGFQDSSVHIFGFQDSRFWDSRIPVLKILLHTLPSVSVFQRNLVDADLKKRSNGRKTVKHGNPKLG